MRKRNDGRERIGYTKKGCGDVTTPLEQDWVVDSSKDNREIGSKDCSKITRMELGYKELPTKYKRYKVVLELLKEVRSKYDTFLLNKFDFVNTKIDYTPEDWNKCITAFTNNYRHNSFLAEWMITYFYCIEMGSNGYWHMHMCIITKNKWTLANKEKNYIDYNRDMDSLGDWLRGMVIRNMGVIDAINFTPRSPLNGSGQRSREVIYSKNNNYWSINCDNYWCSYFCKENEGTREYIRNNGKVRLFGKGIVR